MIDRREKFSVEVIPKEQMHLVFCSYKDGLDVRFDLGQDRTYDVWSCHVDKAVTIGVPQLLCCVADLLGLPMPS